MVILINGAFGVGKSTVAKILRRRLKGSLIYDPEWAGMLLARFPSGFGLKGGGTDDFQDIVLWRRFTISGIRAFERIAFGDVIVPMAISQKDYFDEIVYGVQARGSRVQKICLKASPGIIQDRLRKRRPSEWIKRRNIECFTAHQDPHFGEAVDTDYLSAAEIANVILRSLDRS